MRGRARLTTVPSSIAMPEPSTVASSTHRAARLAVAQAGRTIAADPGVAHRDGGPGAAPAASRRRAAMPPSASNTTRWAALTVRSLTS